MTTLFVLIWLATLIAIPFWGIKFAKFKIKEKNSKGLNGIKTKLKNIFKSKENQTKKSRFTGQQLKGFLIASIVISFVSFIGIGVTAPPVENNYNNDTTITENNDNQQNNITEENNTDNTENSEIEQTETENETKEDVVTDFTEVKQQSLSSIPATLPSDNTIILSHMPKSSVISEDTIITPLPFLARSKISWYISYFAPTSIPLVGSSSISISGSVRSHLPKITFC